MLGDILDRTNSYLQIFMPGSFEVDRTLPKFKKENEALGRTLYGSAGDDNDSSTNSINFSQEGALLFTRNMVENSRLAMGTPTAWTGPNTQAEESDSKDGKKNVFSRIIEYFSSLNKPKENEPQFDVFKFFEAVKLSSKEAQEDYVDSVNEFTVLLKNANDMGQWALVDDILHKIDYYKLEAVLHAEGHLYKISEEQLVNLVKKTEKGLRLDYIKNFVRVIPKEVIEAKRKADSLMIFDNYVVLHYDPGKKAAKQTNKEKEQERKKKADPILFGVIEHSRDLYYITDWVDDKCNLTLDELAKLMKVEKSALEIKKASEANYNYETGEK